MKSLKADVIYLQATHIKNTTKQKLRMGLESEVFQSNFGARARGVAIIIKKNISFEHSCTIGDPNGRFLIVSGKLNGIPVTLINIYGPNFDDPSFFQTEWSRIPDVGDTNIIMGGNFSCVIDASLDSHRRHQ